MMRTQHSELCFEAKFTYSVSKCAHPHFLFWKEPEPHFLHMKTQHMEVLVCIKRHSF